VDYTTLSLAQVQAGLEAVAADTQATFGRLDSRQLNWRPDASRWSTAQCLEHLLTANRLMVQSAREALDGAKPPTIWQRLPVLPGMFGRMLIRSQAPQATRKFHGVAAGHSYVERHRRRYRRPVHRAGPRARELAATAGRAARQPRHHDLAVREVHHV
jgi:hypothetical protein